MTTTVSTRKLLFYLTTWCFLGINILIAWLPIFNLPLLAIRESWMILLLVFICLNRSYISLCFILIIGAFGAAPFVNDFVPMQLLGYFYGFRDIFLLVLLVELAKYKSNLDVTKKEVNVFVFFVMILAFIDFLITNVLDMGLMEFIFRTKDYYGNKGIDINLSNGILGDRVGVPLYSPNLICTLLAAYYFLDSRINRSNNFVKLFAFIVAVVTMTKVIIFSLCFYVLGRFWALPVLMGILSLFPFYLVLHDFYISLPTGLLKYHIASVLGHLHAFDIASTNNIYSFIPEPLGSHSIAMKVLRGDGSSGPGIESSILARASELKIYYLFVVAYIIYSLISLKNDVLRKFIAFFVLLSLLTATSNQPVAWVPILFLIRSKIK
jgi:hypothetical protein